MKHERQRFTAYITKYALTKGIEKATVEDCFDISGTMVNDVNNRRAHYHKGEWHRSREDAVAKAEEMRIDKIISLKKSLTKFETMKFS